MSPVRFAFLVTTSLLASCGSNVVDNTESGRQPTKTQVGVPGGTEVSKVIGATGGQLTSADGLASITIPAGALTSNQTIGIQPITATSPAPERSRPPPRISPTTAWCRAW